MSSVSPQWGWRPGIGSSIELGVLALVCCHFLGAAVFELSVLNKTVVSVEAGITLGRVWELGLNAASTSY